MKRKGYYFVLIFVVILFLWLFPVLKSTFSKQEKMIAMLQDDDIIYTLINKKGLTDYADMLVIYKVHEEKQWQSIYESDFPNLKPWKLEVADIDGDGIKEILIAVHKATHFDEHEKNRLFIFNFDGEKLVKKWTGSQIAGMWDNFYVGELLPIPGEELIFIEKLYDQGVRLHVYYWFNFGFMLLASSDIYEEIIDVTLIDENRIQITNNNEQGEQTLTLLVKDGEISSVFR